jgi:NADP-dependent aldehyde dehydrogenase
MPAHVFQHVSAAELLMNEIDLGKALVQDNAIAAVGFTGSTVGGRALLDYATARKNPIPVFAEMGSVNPVILLKDIIATQAEAIATQYAGSITLGVGQFCTNPGLLILLKSDEGFLDLVASRLNTMPLGTFLTKGIKEAYANGTKSLANHTGVQQLTSADLPSPALFKISAKEAMNHPEVLEEVFGPSTLAVVANDMEEMIAFIESIPGQLTATVQGELSELKKSGDLIEALTQKVGRILLNGFPTGVEVSGAMVHGGPFPSTTDSRSTSVGTQAIYRFTRPVCFQNFSSEMIP